MGLRFDVSKIWFRSITLNYTFSQGNNRFLLCQNTRVLMGLKQTRIHEKTPASPRNKNITSKKFYYYSMASLLLLFTTQPTTDMFVKLLRLYFQVDEINQTIILRKETTSCK